MLIYDDIYSWDGWGGKLKLASGRCHMKIYDLRQREQTGVALLKPFVVVVSDLPFEKQGPNQMTVKSCAGHIATRVVREFKIDPHRMVWVEHYRLTPEDKGVAYARERFEEAEFTWTDSGAISPRWKPLNPALEKQLRRWLDDSAENPEHNIEKAR